MLEKINKMGLDRFKGGYRKGNNQLKTAQAKPRLYYYKANGRVGIRVEIIVIKESIKIWRQPTTYL